MIYLSALVALIGFVTYIDGEMRRASGWMMTGILICAVGVVTFIFSLPL